MPAKLKNKKQIPSDAVPSYDELLITNVITPVHFNGDGNLEIGDTVEKDNQGKYIKVECIVVHYVLLNAGVAVHKGIESTKGADLLAAMGRNPNARNEIKGAAYDILSNIGVIPADATIS